MCLSCTKDLYSLVLKKKKKSPKLHLENWPGVRTGCIGQMRARSKMSKMTNMQSHGAKRTRNPGAFPSLWMATKLSRMQE